MYRQFGTLEGFLDLGRVVEGGVRRARVLDGFGVVDADVGALALKRVGDAEGRGVPDVVAVGFEGGAQDGDSFGRRASRPA